MSSSDETGDLKSAAVTRRASAFKAKNAQNVRRSSVKNAPMKQKSAAANTSSLSEPTVSTAPTSLVSKS